MLETTNATVRVTHSPCGHATHGESWLARLGRLMHTLGERLFLRSGSSAGWVGRLVRNLGQVVGKRTIYVARIEHQASHATCTIYMYHIIRLDPQVPIS